MTGVWQRLSPGVDAVSPQDHSHFRETASLRHVRQGVQPIIDAQHSQTHPSGNQAFRLWHLRQRIPPEGQLQEPSTHALRTQAFQMHYLRQSFSPGQWPILTPPTGSIDMGTGLLSLLDQELIQYRCSSSSSSICSCWGDALKKAYGSVVSNGAPCWVPP